LKRKHIRGLTESAIIAAIYCVLTLALSFISFGPIQFRVSEALTILPVFSVTPIWGVSVGCLISNIVGLAMGANLAGAWDILFGSLTTLLAALCTRGLRHYKIAGFPLLSIVPPVLFNALVVGAELSLVIPEVPFWLGALQVGIGQAVVLVLLGLPLFKVVERSPLFQDRF